MSIYTVNQLNETINIDLQIAKIEEKVNNLTALKNRWNDEDDKTLQNLINHEHIVDKIMKIFNVDDNTMYIKTKFKNIYDDIDDIKSISYCDYSKYDKKMGPKYNFNIALVKEFYTNIINPINENMIIRYKEHIMSEPWKSNGIKIRKGDYNNKLNFDKVGEKIYEYDEIIDFLNVFFEKEANLYVSGSRLLDAVYEDSVKIERSDMDIAIYFHDRKMGIDDMHIRLNQILINICADSKNNGVYSLELVKRKV